MKNLVACALVDCVANLNGAPTELGTISVVQRKDAVTHLQECRQCLEVSRQS